MTPPSASPDGIRDVLERAIPLWSQIVGLPKHGEVLTLGQWSAQINAENTARDLSAAEARDPSGLTTVMLLRGWLRWRLEDTAISAFALLHHPERVHTQMAPLRALHAILSEQAVEKGVRAFQDAAREAAVYYCLDPDESEAWVSDEANLAGIRRDALCAMDTASRHGLEEHQFSRGEASSTPPRYEQRIFEFWNANSYLRAMIQGPPAAITVALIRDPEALHSFFVIGVRNGDNLYLLTDRTKESYPNQRYKTRRPDRDFARRAVRFWFPYDLVEVKPTEDDRALYAAARTALVPYDVKGVPIVDFKSLHPASALWLALVFDLIRERYFRQVRTLAELSYTGEMVVEPHALVGSAGALVLDGHYTPLEVPRIHPEDITPAALAGTWDSTAIGNNAWMEERYGSRVPDAVLNIVGASEAKRLAAPGGLLPTRSATRVNAWGGGQDHLVRLQGLDPLAFGTAERIARDRVYTARANFAAAVERLAEVEFDETVEQVRAWYKAAIQRNRGALIEAAVRGELLLPEYRYPSGRGIGDEPSLVEVNNLVQWLTSPGRWYLNDQDHPAYYAAEYGPRVLIGRYRPRSRSGEYLCCDDAVPATVFTRIRPQSVQALAILCRCGVEDLPLGLQRAIEPRVNTGNSLLRRLDPMDHIRNPWAHHLGASMLTVGVALSARAYARRRKDLGLSPTSAKEVIGKEQTA